MTRLGHRTPKFTDNAFKTDVTPGQPYDYGKLPEWDKLAQGLGIKHGFEEIQNYDARLS
jgi:hypothetical protein